MRNKYEDFDEFVEWLKKDGLKPKISERLWRKKIFSNLQNGHKKSLVNYEDFIFYKKLNNLLGKNIIYKDIDSSISEIKTEHLDCVLLMLDSTRLRIKLVEIDKFIDNYMRVKDEL
ncbi:MAG: hypothetical protein GW906_02305 [Epsilonproteobacteria bacterium]|nr:hypothetical protein [Campylobacterota bacterium]PIP09517.1 MAG: hypothetical protein COX50_10570 [Sulfurimonas sp. CG23_combo_of_CG06-09_8_20_14_all_36_33]PIS27069.1 MAG: hypothetical protein COT46_00110 [Sulfurimonas sp. CG08_land_8_20_14_0_20_36_33]PIU35220.1 MAG: hypothetical protein COT05_04315 [Sulfurimonas sp. CG07_land_8_20_14_0_80_36_56]PIV04847.1 MAG: hypothetical protein COS56_03490 [Sulfurimonas sp. CG03_land_8_20_14_0_80_36_25]PIV33881.1 MAG: hypothetical protein COS32_12140 [S